MAVSLEVQVVTIILILAESTLERSGLSKRVAILDYSYIERHDQTHATRNPIRDKNFW